MNKLLIVITLMVNIHQMNAQNQDPWGAYMTPSEVHALLSDYTGSFKMEITMPVGEGKEPSIITVNSEHIMLLGGRFLELKQQGKMMGMDYQSIMNMGFNNTDKQMSLTTITNMGTGTLSLFGAWDAKLKTATLYGTLTNPVSKGIINVKQVVTFVDKDTILIESFDQEDNYPVKKTVQYKLTRAN